MESLNSNSNNSSLSTEYFTPSPIKEEERSFSEDKDEMLERIKKVSDLGVKGYAFKGVGSTEAKKKATGEARIERLLAQNAKETETQLQQIRNKMRNLYLEKGDPKYPPHNGSRGVAEFNALLHQRHGMFGFTKQFDDYRTIRDLDVLKDMYNKMKTVYRENQPTRKDFEKSRQEFKKSTDKVTGYMPLHVKIDDATFRQMRNKMNDKFRQAPSTRGIKNTAVKTLLPFASRKVRKEVTKKMNENYEGGRKRTRRRRRRRKTRAPKRRVPRSRRRTRRKRRY